MSKKVKEVRSSVSTSTSAKVKEVIKPAPRMKMIYDSRTGFVTRVSE